VNAFQGTQYLRLLLIYFWCASQVFYIVIYRINLKKCPNTKIMISQKCANIFVPSFARLFTRQLHTSVLICAVFTWHYWRKRKLQEPILQLHRLYKRLILLLKWTSGQSPLLWCHCGECIIIWFTLKKNDKLFNIFSHNIG